VRDADARSGRLVLLGGEAGVGKTSLVGLLATRVGPDVRVLRGFCDNVAIPPPLGPLVDALPELADAIDGTTRATRPRLFRHIRARLTEGPTVLVLEDVHWADEATLELMRFLGRRLEGVPLLAVATFRDDQVGPGDPLTALLGDLATAPHVDRMHLPALSAEAVAALVADSGSGLDVDALFERTGGNPFFVTEVLAAGAVDTPPTVRDAVLARISQLSQPARDVLAAPLPSSDPARRSSSSARWRASRPRRSTCALAMEYLSPRGAAPASRSATRSPGRRSRRAFRPACRPGCTPPPSRP
jgi:predicted ATPase